MQKTVQVTMIRIVAINYRRKIQVDGVDTKFFEKLLEIRKNQSVFTIISLLHNQLAFLEV